MSYDIFRILELLGQHNPSSWQEMHLGKTGDAEAETASAPEVIHFHGNADSRKTRQRRQSEGSQIVTRWNQAPSDYQVMLLKAVTSLPSFFVVLIPYINNNASSVSPIIRFGFSTRFQMASPP